MGIHPQVAGRWLADICPFGEVSWATTWEGGLDVASWAVPTKGSFPELRRGAAVPLFDGGLAIGRGYISEVNPGEVHVEGLWRLALNVLALDGSGNPTTVADTAIDEAIARGDLPGWSRPVSISPSAMGTSPPDTAMTVAEVLTKIGEHTAQVPYIDAAGAIRLRGLPAAPTWQTTPVDGKLTTASDEFATHLIASYLSAATTFTTRTYPAAAVTPESERWGKVTRPVALWQLGVTNAATVDLVLAGMLDKGKARPTWAGTLEVTATELTTIGGTPAYLAAVEAGQGVRLNGTFDDSRLLGGYSYTDITAGRVEYVDGAATARITPVGYTPRDFKSILSVALEGVA